MSLIRSFLTATAMAATSFTAQAADPACEGYKKCRPLTGNERAFAEEVFENKINYSKVRIVSEPYREKGKAIASNFPYYVKPGIDKIHVPQKKYQSADFLQDDDRDKKYHFLHEMTHIWQNQNGIFPNPSAIKGLGLSDYSYHITHKTKFLKLNFEQQAQVVRDFMVSKRTLNAPNLPSNMDLETMCGNHRIYKKVVGQHFSTGSVPKACR